jgi:hypothetical protein
VVNACAQLTMGLAFAFVMYTAAAAFLLAFFPEGFAALRAAGRRIAALDAFLLLLMAIGLWHICHQFAALLMDRLHALAVPDIDGPTLVDLPAPAVTAVANAVRSIFSRAAMLAVLALAIRKLPKRWMLIPLVLLAVCASVADDVRTPAEFALEYAVGFVTLASALLFCLWFARNNYLAYVLILGLAALHPAFSELLHSGNSALATQGWAVAAVMLAGLAWALGPGLMRGRLPR